MTDKLDFEYIIHDNYEKDRCFHSVPDLCHSGVGAKSATVGYGLNRADWSYIPGGVVSGTALIRPDFPELLVFPFLWQQVEYVLAAKDLMQY